jgi:nicotinate-nucleotide adenylyltransferase
MKIAFFGGTFDPPHRGHLALACLALDRLHLDRVLMAPVGAQPLKRDLSTAGFADRIAMTRLAIAGHPHLELSLADEPRLDGRPNYTVDTITALRRTLQPPLHAEDRLFCLMGADSFLTIGKWHRAGELLTSCDFIVGARPGFDLTRIAAALPDSVSVGVADRSDAGSEAICCPEADTADNCLVLALTRETGRRSFLYLLPDLAEDISATEIRTAIAGDESPAPNHPGQPVLAPAVLSYIRAHSLYQNRD